jgi:hypothetical protein
MDVDSKAMMEPVVQPSPIAGRGLFARQDYPKGCLVLADPPSAVFIATAHMPPEELTSPIMQLAIALQRSTHGQGLQWFEQRQMMVQATVRDNSFVWLQRHPNALAPLSGLAAIRLLRLVQAYSHAVRGLFFTAEIGSALHPVAAHINHSCQRNCDHFFQSDGTFYLVSIRPIKAGEELTITYVVESANTLPLPAPVPSRDSWDEGYVRRFEFECSDCHAPAPPAPLAAPLVQHPAPAQPFSACLQQIQDIDVRRYPGAQRMVALATVLMQHVEECKSVEELFGAELFHFALPHTLLAAPPLAESLTDMDLQTMLELFDYIVVQLATPAANELPLRLRLAYMLSAALSSHVAVSRKLPDSDERYLYSKSQLAIFILQTSAQRFMNDHKPVEVLALLVVDSVVNCRCKQVMLDVIAEVQKCLAQCRQQLAKPTAVALSLTDVSLAG